jgi:hypothetical protein
MDTTYRLFLNCQARGVSLKLLIILFLFMLTYADGTVASEGQGTSSCKTTYEGGVSCGGRGVD